MILGTVQYGLKNNGTDEPLKTTVSGHTSLPNAKRFNLPFAVSARSV
jgi:hypothetical protein